MKTVLVTGAGRGLGLEFVRQYREAGWNVLATARRPAEASQTCKLGAEVLALDVQDENAIRALPASLGTTRIDVLINNAGYYPKTRPLGELDYSDWQTAFHVNVIAPLQIVEALLPLIPEGGKIVNIGSRQGSMSALTSSGNYLYRASKAALHSVTRSLSIDLAQKKIFVVAFHPGWVRTAMGGVGAEIDPPDSIFGMRRVIDKVGPDETGRLFNYDGEAIPW